MELIRNKRKLVFAFLLSFSSSKECELKVQSEIFFLFIQNTSDEIRYRNSFAAQKEKVPHSVPHLYVCSFICYGWLFFVCVFMFFASLFQQMENKKQIHKKFSFKFTQSFSFHLSQQYYTWIRKRWMSFCWVETRIEREYIRVIEAVVYQSVIVWVSHTRL